jgi:acetate---CoA ligase (ADP-forming) subunit beta
MAAPREIIQRFRKTGRPALDEAAAKDVLAAFGIAVPRRVVLPAGGAIANVVDALAPPFALKLVSSTVLHKSDVGGVAIGLRTRAEIAAALERMASAAQSAGVAIDGYLLEEMAPRGHELVIGGLIDRTFGPVVMVGLGGVFVEILADVAFRICPIRARDANEMLHELRGAPILKGARGGVVASEAAIIDVLLRVAGPDGLLAGLANELREIDINPLIVSRDAAVAVDARIILKPSASHG